jgi:tRNA dimethylallyltransferase
MQKLIVILGPTASGKSALGVQLALRLRLGQAKKKFGIHGAEIISADSRQAYKGLDIGSGKITKKEMRGVPHHLLDIASPKRRFTVSQYRRLAMKAMASITRRRKLPILVGGSPLYIYAVTDGWVIPEVKPNVKLRKQLERLSTEQLLKKLQKLDPERARIIEQKNPRRLIRALEIIMTTGKPVPQLQKHPLPYPVLFLGVKKSFQALGKLIEERLHKRLRAGMVKEVKALHASGLSWNRLEELGLEYRFVALYLQQKLSYQEMTKKLQGAIEDFSRRQMTWFKKDQRIHWIISPKACEALVRQYLG